MPGPAVWKGGATTGSSPAPATPAKEDVTTAPAAAAPTTMSTVRVPTSAPTQAAGQAGCAALYAQCGGQGFTGAKCCATGSCKEINAWYSQCTN
jgi:hypothetical protein